MKPWKIQFNLIQNSSKHTLCTNMHTHTHKHVYKRIDVQIHIHMHIYTYIMSAHIHIYTHAHTKCTYERTQSTSETTARQRLRGQPNLTPRISALLPVCITTARRPDHPLICTGAEPIHPVHCPRQCPAWPCQPMAPRNEVIFLPFWRGFLS